MHLEVNSVLSCGHAGIGGASNFFAGSTAARILGMKFCIESEKLNKSFYKVKADFKVGGSYKWTVRTLNLKNLPESCMIKRTDGIFPLKSEANFQAETLLNFSQHTSKNQLMPRSFYSVFTQ